MDDAPSGDRRTMRNGRARRRNRVVITIAVVVGLVVVAAIVAIVATGGDDTDSHEATRPTTHDRTTVDLRVGDVASDSAGPTATFTAAQAQGVVDVIRAYVDGAIVAPLRSGTPSDLSTVFDAGALATVNGADKAVMTDTGLPKVTGDVSVRAKPVNLVALGDQSGTVVLVSATVDLTVDGKPQGAKVPMHVARTGDLVLAPDGSGGWRITSYSISVSRSGAGVGTTTSSPPPTTKKGAK
jgi:hypothetical protein